MKSKKPAKLVREDLIIAATIERYRGDKTRTPYINIEPATRALLERYFLRTTKGTKLEVTLSILPRKRPPKK
jgi:hypothetical protein